MGRGAALVGRPHLRADDQVNSVLVRNHETELNFAEQETYLHALGRLGPLSCTRYRACTCGPCYPVVYRGPYSLLGMGRLILGSISRLDAVSASHVRA